jgi:CHAT domain-containing protein
VTRTVCARIVPFLWVFLCPVLLDAEGQGRQTQVSPVSSAAEEVAISSLVDQFYAAYAQKDQAAISGLWSSKSPDLEAQKKANENFFAANDKIQNRNVTIQWLEVEGEKAHVRTSLEMLASDAKTGSPSSAAGKAVHIFDLVKDNHSWKIWRKADAYKDLAQRLAAAETESQQDVALGKEKDLVNPALTAALNQQGIAFRSQRDIPKARASFQLMEKVAAITGDRKSVADAVRSVGDTFNMQGDHRKALEFYEKSLEEAKQTGDKTLITRSLLSTGIAHGQKSDFDDALLYFREGLRVAESVGAKLLIARALNDIGLVYHLQGKDDEALPYHLRVFAIYEEEKQPAEEIAGILTNLGVDYKSAGNYARALEVYQRSLALLGPNGDKDQVQLLLNNIGSLYESQGDDVAALDHYNRSLAISKELNDKESIELTLKNIGVIEEERGHYDAALDYFRKSLALSEQLEDKWGRILVLNHIGEVQALQGKTADALATYENDLTQSESLGVPLSAEMICNNIAELYYGEGKFEEALQYAQRASATAVSLKSRDGLWRSRALEGAVYRRLDHPAQARQALEESIDAVEDLRGQIAGGPELQQGFFEDKMRPYREMMELLISQNQLFESLQYSERARGRVLLDVLSSSHVNITKAMTDAERGQERHLQDTLVSLNKQVEKEGSAPNPDKHRMDGLGARLGKARTEYHEFLTALYAVHPELEGIRGQKRPLSPQEIGQLVPDPESAFLEFAVSEKRTRVFVLTKEHANAAPQLHVYTAEITAKELADKTEHLRGQIAQRNLACRASSQELYRLLLKPVEPQLRGRTTLIIVPDGPLWNLPFQALVSRNNRYLLEDYAIGYAPSFTVLREMIGLRKQRLAPSYTAASTTLLAMGNPALGNRIANRAQLAYRDESLEPLPEAEREVKALKRIYSPAESKTYVGPDAEEGRFKAEAGTARLLHLATHGFLNDSNPMYSHILLSRMEGDEKEDGLLEAWEIMQLDLKAELAVLSACETARGRVSAGEGMIGLAWAFFVAGTPTTVVSQWKVESSSTTELMTAFHRARKANLARSQSAFATARALREAELQLLRSQEYSHPFYWASFVAIGDPN